FFSGRRRHTRSTRDWSSDVCSSDLAGLHQVGLVMSQVSGTVVAIDADETDLVQAGQELVRLDATDAGIALQDAEQQLARTVRQRSEERRVGNQREDER